MEYEYYADLFAQSTTFEPSQIDDALAFEFKFWMESQTDLAYSYAN